MDGGGPSTADARVWPWPPPTGSPRPRRCSASATTPCAAGSTAAACPPTATAAGPAVVDGADLARVATQLREAPEPGDHAVVGAQPADRHRHPRRPRHRHGAGRDPGRPLPARLADVAGGRRRARARGRASAPSPRSRPPRSASTSRRRAPADASSAACASADRSGLVRRRCGRRRRTMRTRALLALLAAGMAWPAAAARRPTTPAGAAASADGELSGTLTVFAAASLTDVFTELGDQLMADNPDLDVRFNFAGSSALATQIVAGRPRRRLRLGQPGRRWPWSPTRTSGRGEPAVFTENVLEIAVPAGNPAASPASPTSPATSSTLAVCAPEVPCGAAAEQVFEAAGITPMPDTAGGGRPRRAHQGASSARSTPPWSTRPTCVARATPSRASSSRRPRRRSTTTRSASWPTRPNPDAAQAFVDLVLSDEGQAGPGGRGLPCALPLRPRP